MKSAFGENKIIVTEDGSNSLYNSRLNETYHSFHGAIQESQHVFIKSGLDFLRESSKQEISVFEMGFGTGLNALLSALWATNHHVSIDYTSVEAFPIHNSLIKELNYPSLLGDENAPHIFNLIHQTEWEKESAINEYFKLTKLNKEIEEFKSVHSGYDCIFYDAFAPSKQPEMWTIEILESIVSKLKSGGVFVTYCAQGQLKRNLKELGLAVETLPGPPGKKEMVRGVTN